MEATLLGLYIKLNLLLAATLLLWFVIKGLARGLGFESNHSGQLRVARYLFLGFLFAAAVAVSAYSWLTRVATRLADGFTVVAGIDVGLERDYEWGSVGLEPGDLVLGLLLAGFAWQLLRLGLQVRNLRAIIGGATEWRCIGKVHLLVSSEVNTPFSTRALGRKHVVLPMALLESPRNLRLAVKHELQHVRNGDLDWVILVEAVKVLCFWNPAAWLWHNEFDCLQEFACDEVLINSRHVTPKAYGTCLLEVASANSGNALLATSNMIPKFALLQDAQTQLKRRITMLTNSRRTKHHALKSACYTLLAGLGLAQTALLVFAQPAVDQSIVPVVRVNPEYPRDALEKQQVAWVHIEFDITADGAVSNPVVVDNCVWLAVEAPSACARADTFDEVSLAALSKWRYQPKLVDGVAVAQQGVQTVISYTLADDDGE